MILIDTSVIVDVLRGNYNEKVKLWEEIAESNTRLGISIYTYIEILQGAKSEKEYEQLDEYLSSLEIYYFPNRIESYKSAAKIYFDLRRKGKTIRSTIDILIAATAIYNELYLLHNDRDFDIIAEVIPTLKIYRNQTNANNYSGQGEG